MAWYLQFHNAVMYIINVLSNRIKWILICTTLYIFYSVTAIEVQNDSILNQWMIRTITVANNRIDDTAEALNHMITVQMKQPRLRRKNNCSPKRRRIKITALILLAMQASSSTGKRIN